MALDNQYWETPVPKKKSSSTLKILATVIILMVVTSGVMVLLMDPISITGGEVKVAILDSGIDSDISLIGRLRLREVSFLHSMITMKRTPQHLIQNLRMCHMEHW